MGKATYTVKNGTHTTYDFKAKIKKAGGKWDATQKCFVGEFYSSDSIFSYQGRLKIEEVKETAESKEKDFDNLYNEGAEGFNPYR